VKFLKQNAGEVILRLCHFEDALRFPHCLQHFDNRMKFSRWLYVDKSRCPVELFELIVQLKPEGYHGGGSFVIQTEAGDEAGARLVDDIVAMCERSGLKKSTVSIKGDFRHDVNHHYEQSDLEAAPLLWIRAQKRLFKGINAGDRDELGQVWLPASEAKPTIKTLSVFLRPWIVVSDKTRDILEGGGLIGLKFDGVSIKGKSIYASSDPFWELRSTIILPPMANSFRNTGVTCESYLIKGAYGEMHYRQSDLQTLGVFDVAFTREPFGGAVPNPELIVSQRFYQHCLKNKVPLEVCPVRIDPD
jgi:hypothetical protein